MFKILRITFLIGLMSVGLVPIIVNAATQSVQVLKVDGTIVPIIADYIDRGIDKAEDENASVCIIELNTPGGLLDTTEKIVQ